jgi:hypothetical protein
MNEPQEALYYECHITIEPVEGERLELFEQLSKKYKFKVANLLMRKSLKRSTLDAFTTAKSKKYEVIFGSMNSLLNELKENNFTIYRDKIEKVLHDSKINHTKFIENE